jgi:hypothetical protein
MTSHAGIFLTQQGKSSFTYVFDGKAIFTHHDLARSRRTEAIYTQHVTVVTDKAMPALRCTRLDGKSRMDWRR